METSKITVRDLVSAPHPEFEAILDRAVIKVHDWEEMPEDIARTTSGYRQGYHPTYLEEWNVIDNEGKILGCLYDDGGGYRYAEGREAGYLDY